MVMSYEDEPYREVTLQTTAGYVTHEPSVGFEKVEGAKNQYEKRPQGRRTVCKA